MRGGRVGGRHVGSRGQRAGETACGRMVGLGGKHQCAGARGDHGHGRGARDHEPGARTFPRLRLTDGRYRLGNEGVTISIVRWALSVTPIVGLLMCVLSVLAWIRLAHIVIRSGLMPRIVVRVPRVVRHVVASYFLRMDSKCLASTVHAATETRLRVGSIQPKTFRPHTRPAARCTRQIRFGRTYSGDPLRPLSQCGFGGGMVERPRRRAV